MSLARRFILPFALCAASLPVGLWAATIATDAPADLVLGQTLFTTNTSQTPATPGSLSTPAAVATDPVSGKVFVADSGNNRVLRYPDKAALTSGAAPDLVIGQLTFSGSQPNQTNVATPSRTSLSAPGGVFVDATGRLWIADTGNNRVLLFENAANLSAVPANADRVYGQPDFVSSLAAPTQSTMAAPTGLCVDPTGTLWVADTGSHRVLGFKTAATLANGANADRVLGQTSFTGNSSGVSNKQFFKPTGVSASATQLWVADSGNNRALAFQNYPTINNAPAGIVLGQKDYISNLPATSATGLTLPTSVFVNGTDVWVADSSNNRVLGYTITAASGNGAAATTVIGQVNLTAGTSGLSSQKLSLDVANQITIDAAGALWVADPLNNRVLRFSPEVTPVVTTTVKITGPISFVTTKPKITLKGTAASAAGISRVSYQIGSSGYFRTTGTTSWSTEIPLKTGRSRLQVIAVGKDGQLSEPAYVTVTRTVGPAVAVSGSPTITTSASSVLIKGTAAASGGIDRVSFQVGKGGYFRATGTTNWSARVNVKPGASRIEFRSVAKNGKVSKPVYVNVTRE